MVRGSVFVAWLVAILGILLPSIASAAATAPTGKCAQRMVYDWDEVGQLAHARRFDFATLSGEALYPTPPVGSPAAELTFRYSEGQRVVKEALDPVADPTYAIDVFPSLRLNHAAYDTGSNTFERNGGTETLYVGGLARVVFQPGLPGSDLHVFYLFGDSLGSASAVVDKATGQVVEYVTHLAYGATDSDYRPAAWQSFREDMRFTGKEEDIEVGLQYFGARYYSPQLGRFISADPLTVHTGGGDLNPYAYVGGRVFNATDPFGLEPCKGKEEGCNGAGSGGGAGTGVSVGINADISDIGRFFSRIFGGGSGRPGPPGTSAAPAPFVRPPSGAFAGNFTGLHGFRGMQGLAWLNRVAGTKRDAAIGAYNGAVDLAGAAGHASVGHAPVWGPAYSHLINAAMSGLRIRSEPTVAGAVTEGAVVVVGAVVGARALTELAPALAEVPAARGGPLAGRGTTVLPGGSGRAIAGHGFLEPGAGTTTVPSGTTASFWTMDGTALPDAVGTLIEGGNYGAIAADPALAAQVEGAYTALPGATVPNYTVAPPVGLTIMRNSRTVGQATPLQRLVGPNMGHLDCAFCLE